MDIHGQTSIMPKSASWAVVSTYFINNFRSEKFFLDGHVGIFLESPSHPVVHCLKFMIRWPKNPKWGYAGLLRSNTSLLSHFSWACMWPSLLFWQSMPTIAIAVGHGQLIEISIINARLGNSLTIVMSDITKTNSSNPIHTSQTSASQQWDMPIWFCI
jgi:hypothetical protein